jgi:tetratricopeptide (TPR) repeat protein
MAAVLRVLAMAQAGQTPKPDPWCAEVLKTEPDTPAAFMCQALIELQTYKQLPPDDPSRNSHLDAAAALFRRTANPKMGPAGEVYSLSYIAGMYADVGRFDDAITTWGTVIAADPDNPEWRAQLATTLDRAGRFGEAERQLSEAIPVVQDPPRMFSELVELYIRHNEHAKAIDLATRWATFEPDNFNAHRLVAWYYWDQYKDDVSQIATEELQRGLMTASAAAERALQIQPRDTSVIRFLEWFLRVRAAIAFDPQEREALNRQAREIADRDESRSESRPLPKLSPRK